MYLGDISYPPSYHARLDMNEAISTYVIYVDI